jgi:tetratricopeptide (TPR) repeat protein
MTAKKVATASKKVAGTPAATKRGSAAEAPRRATKPKGRPRKPNRDWNADPDPGYRPPSGTTKPAAEPSVPRIRERLLPLHEIGSRKFEELCLEILPEAFPGIVQHASLKRTSGVEQYGVDCEGFDEGHEPAVVVSCKCYKDVNPWDIRLWVDEFLDDLDGHWKDRKLRVFVLAITHEFNDDDLNEATRRQVARLRARGISFKLWNLNVITPLVAKDATRVGRYFHSYWVEALALNAGQSVTTVAGHTSLAAAETFRLAEQALSQFAAAGLGQLEISLGERLNEAVAAVRRGRTSDLTNWYRETRANETAWRTLKPAVQANALRAVAIIHIRDREYDRAKELLNEADALHSALDPVERALLARSTGSPSDGLALLPDPSTMRGKELRIALLVEAGRLDAARETASAISGSETTAETLRLRAVIASLKGDREAALRDARSAVERAPHDFLPRLYLGMIRLNAALADGVVPQFRLAPQPINVGLVRDDPAARTLLDGAAADFEAVAMALDRPERNDAEVWHLASLLLHPDRRDEGGKLARRLSSRERPEPLAVAWASYCNVLRRSGRIKKKLGDLVRGGLATPTHLVVLAMLAASGRHPERGAKVIRRYQSAFPEALDFLNGWRVQLGDRTVGIEDEYAVALHSAYHGGDDGPLVEHLLVPGLDVENVLSGAEFLASRSAWAGVDRLRPALLKIGTRRTVELAVIGALNSGRAEECLGILRDIERSSGEDGLPRSLIHMRIRANEHLGRLQPVIADLKKIRRGDADHAIGHRLLDTYIMIGATAEIRSEAERALAAGQLDSERLLRVANALRADAPNVARRALSAATAEEIRPELVGPALSLAADLGDEATRSRMMSLFFTPEREGSAFLSFESPEAMLGFIAADNENYRTRFTQWTSGRLPASAVMGPDGATYARLFLADGVHRRNDVGEAFPMLLRSGALRSAFPGIPGERPSLHMDLSAVLLAVRLGLLPVLGEAFSIVVPPSIQVTLSEMERHFPNVGLDRLAEWDTMLDPSRSQLRIVEAVPDDAVPIEDPDRPGLYSPAIVGRLLDQASAAGRIDRDEAERFLERVGPPPSDAGGRVATAVATPATAYRLLAEGMLDAVVLGAPVHLSRADMEIARTDLDATRAGFRMRTTIGNLRRDIANHLLAGSWTTMAVPQTDFTATLTEYALPFRCLAETMATQQTGGSTYWIEDRTVAHRRQAAAVDVFDILDHLHDRGFIDERRRRNLIRTLRSDGYLFQFVDLGEAQSKVADAPVEGGALVETPALQELRRWFAREAEACRFIDQQVGMSRDGVAGGEMNHLLKLLSLSRRLLERIWSDAGSEVLAKRARSSWVWTNLRVDRLEGLPSDATPESRRQMLAISLAHVLDLPLASSLSEDGEIAETFQPFVDWFVAEHLDLAVKADPDLGEAIANIVAAVVSPIVDQMPDIPNVRPETVRRFLAIKVHRFLDLLPDRWRSRIEGRPGIRELLGLQTGMVLTVADKEQIPIAKLAEACATARAGAVGSASASVPVELGRRNDVRIDLFDDATVIKLALTIGEATVQLEPAVAALLLPDARERSAALRRIEDLADPLRSIRSDDLDRIAAMDDADDRFESFSSLAEADFHAASEHVGDETRESGKLNIQAIDLPSVAALRGYLRQEHPQENADAIWSRLIEEFGPSEAGRRAAGLPFDAPPSFLGGYAASADQVVDRERRIDAVPPLRALLLLQSAVATGRDAEALATGIEALVGAVSHMGKLFVSLVRYGTMQAVGRADWSSLEPTERLRLLWVYADRFSEVLSPPGIVMDEIAEWIGGKTRFDLVDLAEMNRQPEWIELLAHGLTAEAFEATVAARALRIVPEGAARDDLSTRFRERIGSSSEQGWIPSLSVATPRPEAPAGYWPASDPMPVFVEAGWLAPTNSLASRTHDAMANRLLEEAEGQPDDYIVPIILSIIDASKVEHATARGMLELLDRIKAEAMLEPEVAGSFCVMSARAKAAAALGDVDGFRTALKTQAGRAAAKWRDETLSAVLRRTPTHAAFESIVDNAYRHARLVAGQDGDRLSIFAQHVAAIVQAWPLARQAAIGTLDAFVRGSSCEAARDVWPILLELRRE